MDLNKIILNILTTTGLMTNPIVLWIVSIASIVTALTVITHFLRKSNDTVNERIRREAKEVAIEEANKERFMRESELKNMETVITQALQSMDNKLDNIVKAQKEQAKKQDKQNKLLQSGHIETWKNDIRTIYYNLRDTGTISDVEKSYVDKIYHLYKEMGGNSDIDAKYSEMVSVYTRRLREAMDEAHANTKNKRGRPKMIVEVPVDTSE